MCGMVNEMVCYGCFGSLLKCVDVGIVTGTVSLRNSFVQMSNYSYRLLELSYDRGCTDHMVVISVHHHRTVS